jgi:peptide chain release factor
MILQISSGKGPVECRVAVGGIYRALKKEFSDIEMITAVKGEAEGAFSSIVFSSVQDLSRLEGTMQWICKSKYRPGHKRKNWFVDVSIIPEPEEISEKLTSDTVRIEKFHSGGPGGQNVNKVETGVRVRHIPTGIMVENTETRSQQDNRQNALRILKSRLYDIELQKRREKQAELEGQKKKIEWGSQIRSYVLHPYKLVKDVRTGYETADTQGVLDGDLNAFMKEYLMQN